MQSHSSHPGSSHPETCHTMQCIIPPHMCDAIKMRGTAKQRKMVEDLVEHAEKARASRQEAAPAQPVVASRSRARQARLDREVFDAKSRSSLPGSRVRGEGDPDSDDEAVNQAYDCSADVYNLYLDNYGRDSLDGQGLKLTSSVHVRRGFNNAYWDGRQMAYGDGDGVIFTPLVASLTVVGHELSHGVVQFSGGLIYQDQSGALNESFSDVFGALTEQYKKKQTAAEANWLIGAEILGPDVKGEALRSMKAPGTAYDDRLLGKDPQPYHMDLYNPTTSDNGGVHINSGIPNHAFYLLAQLIGGHAWEKAGHIWYDTLQAINNPHATFVDWAELTLEKARERFGSGSKETIYTKRAWKLVGIDV